MNKRTLKIIGIVVAHLPFVLVLILILTILAAIMSATGQEPDTAPVFDQQLAFERIDAALIELDQEYAEGGQAPAVRFFLYAAYLSVFSGKTQADGFWRDLANVAYTLNDDPENPALIAVTDEAELFDRLQTLAGRFIPDDERKTILSQRDQLAVFMAGRFLPPLFDADFLRHITVPFGGGSKGITFAYKGIETLSARAVESGTVWDIGYDRIIGNYVLTEHSDGVQTRYGHLYSCDVSAGETVQAGHILGRIGDSGLTDQPALYLEVLQDGNPVDPLPYFQNSDAEKEAES